MAKILIIDNYRQTLTVIRSLVREGHQIVLGKDSRQKIFTEHSRYVRDGWIHPSIEANEEEFIRALTNYLARNRDIDYVFPVGDLSLLCMARNAHRFDSARLIMPDAETVLTCLCKSRLLAIAADLKIPLLQSELAHNFSELRNKALDMSFPVVVKPNDSLINLFNKKAVICSSPEDLQDWFSVWPTGHSVLIVQKWASGKRHNCYFACQHGKIFAYFENLALRTDRLDESGFYVEGLSVPPTGELKRYCQLLTRALKYHGIGCVQFILDADNQTTHFLELNPHFGANGAFPYYCGLDFPNYALLCKQSDFRIPLQTVERYSANKRAHWLMGDLKGLIHEFENRNLSVPSFIDWGYKMVVAFLRADYHITWNWKDPLPTVFIFSQFFKSVLKSAFRLLRKKSLWFDVLLA